MYEVETLREYLRVGKSIGFIILTLVGTEVKQKRLYSFRSLINIPDISWALLGG